MKNILSYFKRGHKDITEFIDAKEAFQRATYSEQYTREELRDKMIEELQERIKVDYGTYKTYLDITTYSGYREKQVLPDVAEFFRSKNYKVDLHNDENYPDVNVLIINWQNLENFK